MTLAISSDQTDELLSVEEAKRHLRILVDDFDDEIASLIRAARDDCERDTGRTIRASTSRTFKTCEWWCDEWVPPFPPLLGVTSITYYDTDNASQTLSSSNYSVLLSTDGHSRVVWTSTATLPSLYTREDAITVTFTTGYASLDAVPPALVQGWKVRLTELWGTATEGEQRAAVECSKRLLGKVDVTSYA